MEDSNIERAKSYIQFLLNNLEKRKFLCAWNLFATTL